MKVKFLLITSLCCMLIGGFATSCKPGVEVGLDTPTRNQIQKAVDELALQPDRWKQVLSNLTDQISGEVRERINQLKNRMEDFSREVIEDGGIETRCNVDFTGQRVRSALQQMLDNNKSHYTLSPWICHLRPEKFTVDQEGYSTDENLIKATGFGFTPENVNNAQIYITDERGNPIKKLNTNPNHVSAYRMTLNIQKIKFPLTPRNKLRVLWTIDNYSDTSIIIANVPPPLLSPPVLKGARVNFHTTDDDKDGDTNVHVNLICGGSTVGRVSNTWGDFNDHSDSGWKDLEVKENLPKDSVGKCKVELVEEPNGHDEWHFDWSLELTFSDHSTKRFDWANGNVDYDRTTISQKLN